MYLAFLRNGGGGGFGSSYAYSSSSSSYSARLGGWDNQNNGVLCIDTFFTTFRNVDRKDNEEHSWFERIPEIIELFEKLYSSL